MWGEFMKYALITGSTKGIGKEIAIKLLKENYKVIVNYSSDDEAYDLLIKEMSDFKDNIYGIKLSLDSYENSIEFCEKVNKITDNIDVLVLNCGITDKTEFGNIKKEDWEKPMNINLNCPFYIIENLSNIINDDSGRIILMSSVMGKYAHSTSLVYNVSKAGVIALSNSLVKYFAERNITVNCICPGFIETPYHNNRSKESFDRINNKIALHRFGKSEEVANLCMEIINNQYINGSTIDINGGYNYF